MSRDELYAIINGECLSHMKSMKSCSVDAIVTDPPYGLSFMGKEWDSFGSDTRQPGDEHYVTSDSPYGRSKARYGYGSKVQRSMAAFQDAMTPVFAEALRVSKPGAHLLCFGGTRTFHRMACAIEDAGWEIRDTIMWVYGSGFPKSMDVGKAIDKSMNGNHARALEFTTWLRSTGVTAKQIDDATGSKMSRRLLATDSAASIATEEKFNKLRPMLPEVPERIERLVAERTGVEWSDYAKRNVVEVKKNGSRDCATTDILRCQNGTYDVTEPYSREAKEWDGWGTCLKPAWEPIIVARKPLDGTVAHNVMAHGTGAINIDGCRVPIDEGDDVFAKNPHTRSKGKDSGIYGKYGSQDSDRSGEKGRFPANLVHDGSDEVLGLFPETGKSSGIGMGDSGSAARFFYCAKASKKDRGEGNDHPTVKPNDLMRWLVRLVCPKGGVVLDPFMGSGSTGVACIDEEMRFIGIEMDEHYCEIADSRMSKKLEGGVQMTML